MFNKFKFGLVFLFVLLTACGGGGSGTEITADPILTELQKNDGNYTLSFSNTTGQCSGYSITTYDNAKPERLDLLTVKVTATVVENNNTKSYFYTVRDSSGRSTNEAAGLILNDTFTQASSASNMLILGSRFYIVSDLTQNDSGDSYRLAYIDNIVFSATGFSGDYKVSKLMPNGAGATDDVYCSSIGTVTATKI